MDIIFILGMGRSGTSAVTRVLSLCGLGLPDRLVRPGTANPKGYWEPEVALKRNDQFLRSFGSSWHDPSLRVVEETSTPSRQRGSFEAKIARFLSELPEREAVLIKDPRISALPEAWIEAARRQGRTVKIVHVFRHPAEVAASLSARYGLPPEHSQALWLKYNLLPERATRDVARLFVSFAELMGDWRRIVARCNERLGLRLTVDPAAAAAVEEFLSDDLRHQTASALAVPDDLTPGGWLRRVYACLQRAAMAGEIDIAEMDRVYEAYAGVERFFRVALLNYEKRFAPKPPDETRAQDPAVPSDGAPPAVPGV